MLEFGSGGDSVLVTGASVESVQCDEARRVSAAETTAGLLQRVWRSGTSDFVPAAAVGEALAQLRTGGLVVLHDDKNDQGDLIAAAQLTTSRIVNTMVREGGGLVCVALTPSRARELGLRWLPMRRAGGRRLCERTPTMVSVEARWGVSTGISAADRACTIAALAGPTSGAHGLVSPGHVFPLIAAEGGLVERYGRRQAAVDAARLAGLPPAATLCDILDERGYLANGGQLRAMAQRLGVPLVSISELVDARCDEMWSRS